MYWRYLKLSKSKRYYIQYRNKTSLEHLPHRFCIIADNLFELHSLIEKRMIQDQIDILAWEYVDEH